MWPSWFNQGSFGMPVSSFATYKRFVQKISMAAIEREAGVTHAQHSCFLCMNQVFVSHVHASFTMHVPQSPQMLQSQGLLWQLG